MPLWGPGTLGLKKGTSAATPGIHDSQHGDAGARMTMSNDFTGVLDVSHRAGGAWTDAYEYRSVQQYSNDCDSACHACF